MKRKIRVQKGRGKYVDREISYIPVRYIIAMMITVIEVLLIIGVVAALCYFVPYFYVAAWLTEIGVVIRIISADDNPDYKVPWLLFVLILPVAGFMIYLIFSSRKLGRKYVRRLKALEDEAYQRDDSVLMERLEAEAPTACCQARMLCRISGAHLFSDTRQTYFPLGEAMWESLLQDLARAERFIYMEYFIIEEGVFWHSILEILKEKAANGVEIRLVFDDVGCMSTLPGNYAKQLKRYGIIATPFSRLRGQADSEFNNRSHRKITVIDGVIGYTGGINIADEYVNQKPRFGHWKDTAVRLEGEAVWELTKLFLTDFGINVSAFSATTQQLYPAFSAQGEGGYLIPFGDGPRPLYERRVSKNVIQGMLESAKRYAWMTTPYLIPDSDLCQSIERAALRGVDVKIIVPHIPDKKIVFSLTRSFYARLMRAGVEIYEYEPGFIHAKSYLVDGEYAMIGTVNLDHRSLVHHFENGVWMYRCRCIGDLKVDMEATLSKSIRADEKTAKASPIVRLLRAIGRIFAPLL